MLDRPIRTSVIICTVQRTKELTLCIDSILSQDLIPAEIIIVDASSDDATKILVEGYRLKNKTVEFKYAQSRPKLTMQRNIGFRESSGDVIFYFDDDVVLENNFISVVVRIFKADYDHEIGGVAGLIIRRDEKLQKTFKWRIDLFFRKLFFLEHPFGDGRFRLSGFPATVTSMTQPIVVESLPGCQTAYRRQVLDEFQFDENLEGYCFMEDCDFSYRVSRKYKCIRTPFARLYHNSAQTNRKGAVLKKMLIRNHYYLFRKNLPQTAKHKAAFWISVSGCFLKEILSINPAGLMGLSNGLKDILNGSIDNKLRVEK